MKTTLCRYFQGLKNAASVIVSQFWRYLCFIQKISIALPMFIFTFRALIYGVNLPNFVSIF